MLRVKEPIRGQNVLSVFKSAGKDGEAKNINEAFAISFVFQEDEILSFFHNERIIQQEDVVRIASTDNTSLYLFRKNDKWHLQSFPREETIEVVPNSMDGVVAFVKQYFF